MLKTLIDWYILITILRFIFVCGFIEAAAWPVYLYKHCVEVLHK